MRERNWRLDRVAASPASSAKDAPEPSPDGRGVRAPSGPTWTRRARDWARGQVRRWLGRRPVSEEEAAVHDLARALRAADDAAAVERAMLDAAARITGVRPLRCHCGAADEADPPGPRGRVLPLEFAGGRYGWVLFPPVRGADPSWPRTVLDRLETAGTLAAAALCRLGAARLGGPAGERAAAGAPWDASAASSPSPLEDRSGPRSIPALQDATFLHAVLPFAVGQARRHGEPISLLCVAVDRLNGIRELLGRERADLAVRNVGAFIARIIRASDIVARIDDDRIIAVLPRSTLPHSLRIARNVCRAVESNARLLPELPSLTVSIGVAESPACAENVFALLDAADAALAAAKAQGRNRAVAAAPLESPALVASSAG